MKNTEFDNLIRNLRNQKPELSNAELLCDSIITQITSRSHLTKPRFLIWIRTVSSAAAIFLLVLFSSQQAEPKMVVISQETSLKVENVINIDSVCIQQINTKKLNPMEAYFCYMQQNSIKNKQLESIKQQFNN